MAIGKRFVGDLEDGSRDWHIASGYDYGIRGAWFTIRMKFEGEILREIISAAPAILVPYEVLEQKIALLKIAPVGTKIDGVGWHRAIGVFYLRIYENDLPLGDYK